MRLESSDVLLGIISYFQRLKNLHVPFFMGSPSISLLIIKIDTSSFNHSVKLTILVSNRENRPDLLDQVHATCKYFNYSMKFSTIEKSN